MKELLQEISRNNILLEVVAGELKVFANGSDVNPEIISRIKALKGELVQFLLANEQPDVDSSYSINIPVTPAAEHYPLSSSQRRLWVLSQFGEGNIAYNMPGACIFEGQLNSVALEYCFNRLIARHEILRTVFRDDGSGNIRQYVLPAEDIVFHIMYHDLRMEKEQDTLLKKIVDSEVNTAFNLATGPLLRAGLYQVKDDKWLFTYTMHHIIGDAWSMEILINELLLLYNGSAQKLTPLRIQYKDYAAWQQEQLTGDALRDHKAYWLKQFEGELPVLQLPGDRSRPAVKTYAGGMVSKRINARLNNAIKTLGQQQGGTLYMCLLAAVNTLLYRYTSQEDIIIGTSIASREHADLEAQIGFYVNTLALRTQFKGDDSFNELLKRVKKVTLEGYEHQLYPFDELVNELQLQRDMSRSSLFDVMVVLQNTGNNSGSESQNFGGLTVSGYDAGEAVISKFDLTFFFAEAGDALQVNIVYNTDIYNKETVLRLANHLEQLLEAIIANPTRSINRLDYLSREEKEQLSILFAESQVAYPEDKTVVDLFEEQAALTPDAIALVFEGQSFTYRQLNERSDKLAHYLRTSCHIQANDLTGIMLDRSANMIIALLGVLKSGGAYVAIEPDTPAARKEFIIKDTGIKALITQTEYVFDVGYYGGHVFAIDIQLDGLNIDTVLPALAVDAASLAYVIYTSGSTGQPKGVMVSHQSLVDYVFGILDRTNIMDCKSFGLVSTIAADLGNTVLYPSLLTGGALHVFPEKDVMDRDRLKAANLDCVKIVPSHWKALQDVDSIWAPDKCLIFGGEQLTGDVIELIRSHKAGCDVYNHYGPSETTIGKLINRINVQDAAAKITLGKPFCNSCIYIVDAHHNLQPVGVVGEICIGGDGMSAGYLNKADLTAEKFVVNPFKKGERFYKTGDLGRWLANGTVEFLGRKDDQVKIRGYRIELGEIENTLKKHQHIENAVVLAKVNSAGEKDIVAWLVTREQLSKTDLQNWLSRSLPSYMFPNHFVCIPELPLTPNGKIDRKKLPDPEGDGAQSRATYVAPRTAIEQKLVLIWQEVLGKERVGVKDNFFELGGHSLKATRLASQIYKTFEVKVDFHELFTKIVLEEQAELISQAKKTSFVTIPAAAIQPHYPLSSSQRRLWILSQVQGGNSAYNVPGVYVLDGTLNRTALSNSFNTLITRHEILRTVFKEDENGNIRQFIGKPEDTEFTIAYEDVRNEAQQEEKVKNLVQEAISETFDLSAGPLVSASLFQVADNRWVFAFNMHHIISDGWSKEVLLKELLLFYKAHCNGSFISLSPLRIQYKDYSVWQQHQLSGDASNIHKAYWLKQFEGELPVLELPADKIRPAIKTYNGGVVKKRINSELSKGLYTLTQLQGSTLFMGLLATVNALLYRYTNQEDIIIGSQIAGREHADLEDQIGNYLNTLALRTRFKGENSYSELLEIVREVSLDAYAHQLYPFDELVEALPLRYDISRNPLFDVSVVLQNAQMNSQPELPDLGEIKINAYGGVENNISKFDLAFDFMEIGEEIQVSIVYNNDIYLQSTAERLIDHLNRLLEVIIACPDKPINELEFLNKEEISRQLIEFNNTEVAYPHNKTIAALFSAQALKTPHHIAVVFEDRLLTYKDLDEQSNQLAAYLVNEHHVQADDLIGIMLNRSEKVIVAILGILKAGAAYVPVDPEYPEARQQFILSDIGAKILITQTDYIFDLAWYQGTVFAIDVQLETIDAPANFAGVSGKATDLAYVMYTSGSTGNPKGVMVENRSVVRLVKSANYVDFKEEDILLSTGALSFDATSFEYWGMLLNGGQLVMCRQDTLLDTQRLAAEISNRGVNIMWFTAGWLNQLVDSDIGVFKGLKTILAGGDRLSLKHINALLETYPGITIVNGYGPTENTTFSLTYRMSSPVQHIPVGKPINNSTVYIINDKGVLQPVGAVGEICVAGPGLARGYLNNDALTAAKFVENRYAVGERMYKTGDLGRWQADGNIAFIGRKDDQVKIRGYRIELGEIERELQSHQHIDSAVVVASVNASGEKALVAYLVSETILQASDLRWYLSERLPAYMLPAQFVQLDSLPLTPNGKVDKGSLPEPEGIEIPAGVEYVAPANETEAQMVLIWQDVLGRERIGIRDNFFDLGGDSIKILRMVSEVRKKLNFDIPIADIYKNNTIESIIAHVLQDNSISSQNSQLKESEILVKRELEELKERIIAVHPGKENIEDIYPMSDIEKGMVYESLISEGLGIYHDQLVSQQTIADFDLDRFRSAFELLVEKHAILRTSFNLGDYETEVQIVHKKIEFSIPCKDLAGLTRQEHEKTVVEFTQSEIQKPFDATEAPLWRANIFKLSKDEIVFAFQFHHAILDGWSHASFTTELNNLYLQLGEDPLYKPAKLKSSYKDFIIQHTIDIKENTPKIFWQNELAGYKRLDLFTGAYEFSNYIHTLESNYLKKLKRVALELNTTVKVLSLSAYVYMLKVLSCDNEIVTGLVTNTRPSGYEDSDKILGCFLNTIPLKVIVDNNHTAHDLVTQVHNKLIDLKENERLSLLEIAKIHNEDSGNPFFDTFFDFVDFYAYKSITVEGPQAINEESASLVSNSSRTRTNMPLEVVINLTGEVYSARFRLSRELKSNHSTEDLANLYFSILNQIIGAPHQTLQQLEYLRPEEKHQLLVAFNSTEINYAGGKTVIDLFEEQVEKTPDNIALVFGKTVLSYRELNNKCNQLANYLSTQYHVKAGDLIGIMLDRSENMLIAILGILKSGAAYVPIDPAYPATRKEYIIQDTGIKLLLTQTAYIFDLANYGGHVFAMDAQFGELETSIEGPGVKTKPADVAYVIYTSGSTGQPKGCVLNHGNLFNYIEWANNYYFSETTIASFGLFTSLSFDLTVTSIYCSLTQGGTLTIFDQDADISSILKDSFNGTGGINSIKLTPSHVNILQHLELSSTTMACAILGGEEVTTEQVNILKQIHPSIKVYNEYGPTEATVGCVVKELEANKAIEIGKPIWGTSIYILGEDGGLCPIGVRGELYIGGLGVAAGYINRPELTAEKFVANPFREGERMYRTGDLGRWLPDGNIKFLGRKDDQVKVRGYRVELGEIEGLLQSHPQINAGAVLVHTNQAGDKELVAYIAGDSSLTQTGIRGYLSSRLPAYMVPAHFIQLERLPLTTHGKVDKKRLPSLAGTGVKTGVEYIAARNEIERNLVAVYEEVLKKQPIGIKEDFFALGGDSIKSIQVVSRLKQRGYSLTIQDVLLNPVIEHLAASVKTVTRSITQGMVEGMIPLSPIQHYFFERDLTNKHHYNQSVLLYSRQGISEEALRASLDRLVIHHDALRMVYRQTPEGWVQENKGKDQGYSFEVLAYEDVESFSAHCERLQSGIDLAEGPLLKAGLFRGSDGDRLLLVVHHLVIDGVSWRILFEDLSALYQQYITGTDLQLSLKTDSFQYWQEKQLEYAKSETLQKEAAYWSAIESLAIPPLPLDNPQGTNLIKDAAGESFILNEAATHRLLTQCYKAYRTDVNDILLSALSTALAEVFDLDKVLINLEGHGREDISSQVDVTRTVGWFTTMYPVVFDMHHRSDAVRQLVNVKETLHRVPNKGIGYGVLRYLSGKNYKLTPTITFNYLGDFGSGVKAGQGEQLFEFSKEEHGRTISPNELRSSVLEVFGIVVEGKIRLSISYSSRQYAKATIERLAFAYQQQLETLIEKLAVEEKVHLTPVDLTYKELSVEQVKLLNANFDLEDVYPLSPLQEGMYYHWLSAPQSPVYLEQMSYRLKGALDPQVLKESYRMLVSRHAILRTSFTQDFGVTALQVVQKTPVIDFDYKDIAASKDFNIEAYKAADRAKGFDLHTCSQMRLTVLALGDDTYEFIWCHHHILMDGWCVKILIKEFFQQYNSIVQGNTPRLNDVYPYSTYIEWLMDRDKEQSLQYWANNLSGYDAVSALPQKAIKQQGYLELEKRFTIGGTSRQSITSLCAELGITENIFIQSVWGILLSKYNNTNDVVFGSVVSGRPGEIKGIEDMIGLFINTIPVRISMKEGVTAARLLKEVQQKAIEGTDHHYNQLAEIQSASELGRRLFDHILVFENYPVQEAIAQEMESGDWAVLSSGHFEQTNYDFSLTIIPGEAITFLLNYNSHVYDEVVISGIQDHFTKLVEKILENPAVSIDAIDYLGAEEKDHLITGLNDTAADYPWHKTMVDVFEEQVSRAPDAVALVFEENELTYAALNEKANQLARYLRESYAIQPDDLIAIILGRSEWMMIAILGVLKSGAAYVPIDPGYPQERIDYIIADSQCKVVIDEQELVKFRKQAKKYDSSNPASINKSTDLAYVIYTSGTTGKPKGVMIEHQSLLDYAITYSTHFQLQSHDRVIQQSSFSFDNHVEEIYPALLAGACLLMAKEGGRDIHELKALIQQKNATLISTTPTVLRELNNLNFDLNRLRLLISGGERFSGAYVSNYMGKTGIHDGYGPTESTVCATFSIIESVDSVSNIGRPIANRSIYIVNAKHETQPIGVVGEICIGGKGLARGYLNRTDLTAEKFVANPFKEGERMYKTGDLGRWLPDGTIEYIGRKDDQLKIRGYRIEPGEIENVLQNHPDIDAAVVIPWKNYNGEMELAGYIVSGKALTAQQIRTYLSAHLPVYMIPAYFIQLEHLPLNSNGKIDKKNLPDPTGAAIESGIEYITPRNEIERNLVAVYEEVLKKQPIGIKEDFFVLGGDSIKSIQVVSRLKQRGYSLTIQDVLLNPVIEDLAACVKLVTRSINQGSVEGMIPLSPIQQQYFESNVTGKHHYNQSVLLYSRQRMSEEALRAALDKIVLHHDALRMVFRQTPEGWVQENRGKEQGYSLEVAEYIDVAGFTAYCDRIQSSADLSHGPLFRVGLFHGSDGDRLLLVAHHLVIDGVSWRILFEDLSALYQQYVTGAVLQLPLKTDSFQYWQEKQLEYAKSETLEKEAAYWSAIESLAIPPLPLDNPQGTNLIKDAAAESFMLNEAATHRLLTQCYKPYRTDINDILLSALSTALAEVFDLDKVLINLEGHGREDIGSQVDVTRTVGWFTTIYPVVFDMRYVNDSIRQLISVKETLHRIPNKGIGYGVLRYLSGKDYKLNPEITFNYLGDFGTGIKAEQGEQLFEFAHEEHGRSISASEQRSEILDVAGMIVEGKLRLSVSYSGSQYAKATIERLVSAYHQQLEALIAQLSGEEKVHLTPVDLTYKELSVEQVKALNTDLRLEDVYPLSPLQEGMYYQWLTFPESVAYYNQMRYRLKGALHIEALKESYQRLVSRHSVLRTSFTQELGDNILQLVKKDVTGDFLFLDISGDPEFSIQDYIRSDQEKGFNLHSGPLMRLAIFDIGNDTYEFTWSSHHILMDGWCVGILIKEFFEIYHSIIQNRTPRLQEVHPFSAYIEWLMNRNTKQSLQYWANYLSAYDTISALPKITAKEKQEHQVQEKSFLLEGATRQSIKSLCAGLGITENVFMQTVWGILLSKYNNTNDVVFGAVVSGRPPEIKGIEEMIGLFINTIPVRITVKQGATVARLLKEVQQNAIESAGHHYTQLADIQSASELGRGLLDHIVVFENYPVQDMIAQEVASSELSVLFADGFEQTNYDFTFTILPGETITCLFKYNNQLYNETLINGLQQHFTQLIERILENPSVTIDAIDYLGAEEKHQLIAGFNDTAADYPKDKTVIELFEAQAANTPTAIALVYEGVELTYQQLNERCNQLAAYLRDYNIQPDDLIGIKLQRSEWMIIAILAVLKSGGAYVPIDIEYPQDRIDHIVSDSQCKVLIDEGELEKFRSAEKRYANNNLLPIHRPNNLAYVIYTSGTTGMPKGAMIEHSSLTARIVYLQQTYGITAQDNLMFYRSYSFDGSIEEYLMPVITGARCFIAPPDFKQDILNNIIRFVEDHKITKINMPPVVLGELVQMADKEVIGKLTSLKHVVSGGDMLSVKIVNEYLLKFSATLYNTYGPTENTIDSTNWIAAVNAQYDNVSIGKPVQNSQVYILDDHLQLVPVGIPGELYVSGVGIGRGYWNNPELSAEKFVPNPFRPGERMYKTGDLGRWMPDGNIEFIGRKDSQVKVRGYRIELGEIENALQRYPGVEAAVVIAKQNQHGDKELAAYVVSKGTFNVPDLKAYLGKTLPAYMIPAWFVQLSNLPLNHNGKLDRKKLPEPEGASTGGVEYVAPRNETEEKLVMIWQEILGKERISIKDNFFELGGHSLKVARLSGRIQKQFTTKVALKDVFSNPTIEAVSDIIRANQWLENSKLIKDENRDTVEL